MKKLLIFISISFYLFSNSYELKKMQLDILEQERDRYLRQKTINYSELEKLQLDEKVIKQEFDFNDFIQKKLEDRSKNSARLDELKELKNLLTEKEKEFSKIYSELSTNDDGISKFELLKLYTEIQTTKKELEKISLEEKYINFLLNSEEYNYLKDELKEKKQLELIINNYDSLIGVKNQEIKIIEMEEKGQTLLKQKKLELDATKLEKNMAILNNSLEMKDLETKKDILYRDLDVFNFQLELQNKELTIIEEKVKLGAGSQKELFEKKLNKYDLLEKIVKAKGDIKLKEIELSQ